MLENTENINLICKLAWSYNATTGIDIEELIGEATLAYYEAKASYHPSKGELTTWVTPYITNHLTNFIRKERTHVELTDIIHPSASMQPFFELAELFSVTALKMINKIMSHREDYVGISGMQARGDLGRAMLRDGWTHEKVWDTIREIKLVLAEN